MNITFDLISDLHVDTWDEPFSWEGKATSLYAVVAGDISRERADIRPVLEELNNHYKVVMYVDGNDEHRWTMQDLADSYKTLHKEIENILQRMREVGVQAANDTNNDQDKASRF